jgi:hypothetical protein
MCSKIAAPSPGSLLAGQMVTWGEDWFGEDGREMAVPRDIVHDYIFTLDRQTAAQLVEDLLDDIMSGPQQPDWVDSLSAACPAHRALADQGDATLECLLARRLRINGWHRRARRERISRWCARDTPTARRGAGRTLARQVRGPMSRAMHAWRMRCTNSTSSASPRRLRRSARSDAARALARAMGPPVRPINLFAGHGPAPTARGPSY